jgi:hypothetical protein
VGGEDRLTGEEERTALSVQTNLAQRCRKSKSGAGHTQPPAILAVPPNSLPIPEGMLVIQVMGEARADGASTLEDGLLAAAARRSAVVTLDMTKLRFISSLAMGILVTYRRGVVRNGGSRAPGQRIAAGRARCPESCRPS